MGKTGFEALSRREREVLRAVSRGLSTPEIAHELGLSENTVNGYANAAKQKVGAPNRRHAAYMLSAHEAAQSIPQELRYQNQRIASAPETDAVPVSHWVEEERATFAPFEPMAEDPVERGAKPDPLRTTMLIALITMAIVILLLALRPLADSAAAVANSIDPITFE